MNMAVDIKVSVIIPVYNAEKYLRECLDSVCSQSLQNIEIICVDDGSTDNSLTILREYVGKDERLKVIEQVNSGAGAARNLGMATARGEYLAFLDSDDLYYPQALAQAYAVAVKENADMVAFEAKYFNENVEWSEGQLNRMLLAGRKFVSAQIDGKFLFQLASCNTWCKLYKREFVQRKGLRYQEIKTANDLCFVCSALALAARIAVLDKPLVKHRVLHSGNLQSVKIKTPLDFMAALELLKQNLQRFGLWEQLRQSYLNCALGHFVYNWQTLDRAGRKQIVAKSREITELLAFAEHTADYYYSRNDYVLICDVVEFQREDDLRIMGKLKNMLKHILPPPVKAFNREVAGIKQYMLELNAGLMAQQEHYAEQLEMLAKQSNERFDLLENKNLQLFDLLNQQKNKVSEIEQKQQQIRERLGKLDELTKLDCLQSSIEESKKDILSKQTDQFAGLQKEIQKQANDSTNLIAGISKDLQQMALKNKELQQFAKDNKQLLGNLPQIRSQIQRIESGALRLQKQPRLSYFVLNILDHCNLRCKGCDHFACIAEERFVSLESIRNDVKRFSELMHGAVTRIGVMGGEPLLHPNLIEILQVTRQAFPDTLIHLVTNGLLLLRMNEKFWECCCENNIVIVNTKYPINQKYDLMQQKAAEHNVKFEFYGNTGEVQKTSYKMPMDINGRQNPVKSFWECYHGNSLPLLMEGKFYSCTVAPNVRHFNKRFGTTMEVEPGDYLDIYKIQSADEIFEFLSKPKPFCRYCMTDKRSFGHPWERSKQQMNEWTLDE